MPELLEQSVPTEPAPASPPVSPAGGGRARVREDAERLARQDLRRQIGGLERELGELFATAFPRAGIEFGVPAAGGPRVLGVRDLERVRDALAARLQTARAELTSRVDVEEHNRELIERMIVEPERHRWIRVSNKDIGERGCRHWHSRPRWGLLGMILGWWRVKLSSGCPLAGGRGTAASRPNRDHLVATKAGKRPRRPRPDDPPAAPWGSFPLVELVVLVAIVLLIGGFIVSGTQGNVMIGTGLALGSLAGLELSAREHFAGYRSHTLLLAGSVALVVLAALFFLGPSGLPPLARIAIAAAAFGIAAWWLTTMFRRRSGGLPFRLSGLRRR